MQNWIKKIFSKRLGNVAGLFLVAFLVLASGQVLAADLEIELSNNSIDENNNANEKIGDISVSESGTEISNVELGLDCEAHGGLNGPHDSYFYIENNELKINSVADYENLVLRVYQVCIRATDLDTGSVKNQLFDVNVNDINETPRILTDSTSVHENAQGNTRR